MTAPPDDTTTDLHAAIATLRAERDAALSEKAALAEALATRNSEYGERIEQQSATIDVLKVMSASPGDARPVFELIVERARSFCGADHATAALLQDDMLHLQAYRGMSAAYGADYEAQFPRPVDTSTMFGRAILSRDVMQTGNLRAEPDHFARQMQTTDFHSIVAVPILREGTPIGAIALGRKASGGFSDSQIELLKTFAEQGVIAITSAETYRALQERTAALAARNSEYGERIEQQAAMIDVLKVMAASPGDPQPVFDLIVDRARDLCDAYGATVFEFDGTGIHWRAATGVSDDPAVRAAYEAQFPMVPTRGWAFGRAILDRRIIRIDDMEAEPGLDPTLRGITAKSNVTIPIMRGDEVIGAIGMGSREKGGFSDSQIELLKTFAEQAVIAITSAETFRALQTRTYDLLKSLEYQTATSDVLKVISRSTFDLQPVLDTVVETAARLCNADMAAIGRPVGDLWRLVANFGFPPEFEEEMRARGAYPLDPDSPTVAGRAVRERCAVHIHDAAAVPGYPDTSIRLGKQRTSLGVPLLREAEVIGHIVLARQRVEPFTDQQIELVRTFADQAVIAIENTRLMNEQREALEQQKASADILAVISTSLGKVQPVFDKILESCRLLFGGDELDVLLVDEQGQLHVAAYLGKFRDAVMATFPAPVDITPAGPAIREQRVAHYPDVINNPDTPRVLRRMGEICGYHSVAFAPMLWSGRGIGAVGVARSRGAFTEREMAVLQSFAGQAVIAIENARLITEQHEALEQQTATTEVLQVINASPGNLAPVFDAMLEKALRLCDATFGMFWQRDGESFYPAALHGVPKAFADHLMRDPVRPSPNSGLGRTAEGEPFVHITDIADSDAYRSGDPQRRALVDLGGGRTALWVSLRRDGRVPGVITFYRKEVRPFTDKQIALLQNFAAQAVIAMENARLITETREALEQQTATAEVLGVINSNPGDLAPVFDAMLEKAHGLCGIAMGSLELYDGQRFRAVAVRGLSDAFADMLRQGYPASQNPATGPLIDGGRLTHIRDLAETDYAITRSGAELDAARTLLCVPLRRDETLLGMIASARREVRPFSEKEIALLENFAAQAVIAMENARLLTEQQEALERQTAMAEVLAVINANPGELGPVFDTILEKAHRLCDIGMGALLTCEAGQYRAVATRGYSPEADAHARSLRPIPDNLAALAKSGAVRHHPDVSRADSPLSNTAFGRTLIALTGARTFLVVPLSREGTLLGFITAVRREVRPFTERQITLLKNFAAQAVIAMENARLITEQREALEQQTATAEVLQVINATPGDLAPVFDAMLEKAARLCEAGFGTLYTYDGDRFQSVAQRGVSAAYAAYRERHPPELVGGAGLERAIRTRRAVQIADMMAERLYLDGHPNAQAMVDLGGMRTGVVVPLCKDETALGVISVFRQEVRAFSDKQIALLENFAAQAVIAMENARLINEQREALEQQTATAEVLQVINSSPGNLAPVFDAMLDKGMRLCGAAFGILRRFDGKRMHTLATLGVPAAYSEYMVRYISTPAPGTSIAEALNTGQPTQVLNMLEGAGYSSGQPGARAIADLGGARTVLHVPLVKDRASLGLFTLYRQEVRAFTGRQIDLLKNFAAQAVIAMENARLINEQREALEQQTATAEVLQVINSSPGNLQPVFEAILDKAHRICGAAIGSLFVYDGEFLRAMATHGWPKQFDELMRKPRRPTALLQNLIKGERLFHIPDLRAMGEQIPRETTRFLVDVVGVRTFLALPLRTDRALLGTITAHRLEVRPFSEKEIALLENFAAQAVIAMENARLLDEIRQRQEELRITFENMGDGVAMFDETQYLAAWNRKFQDILDLPDALLGQRRTYEEHLRFLAARGDFGPGVDTVEQINELVASTGKPYGYERTRPDGRVIEIRRNPVPGGGFVLIYSDITERKRSEEEIRAARDAAETALRELRTAQANLIQAEKMASLGQLTAGIAHEIKNPLNFVNNFAALSVDLLGELKETAAPGFAALTEKQRAEVEEVSVMLTGNLEKITEHGKRADGIVKAMLEHSRGSSGERRMVDLNAVIDEALNLAYHGARAQDQSFNITLERDFGEGIAPVEVNPQDITRVFLNLFANGFYAVTRRVRDGGDAGFVPTLKVTTRDASEAVEIRVWDNGTGIPADIRDKLFQPFFTTKPTGEGTGLGLSITYDIVTQQHGGSIAVDSKVGEYSEFTIRLPRNP